VKKNNKTSAVIEFLENLSNDDLAYLYSKFWDRPFGDLADAINFMARFPKIEPYMNMSQSSDDLFDFCDYVKEITKKEIRRRNLNV
jgi:hypothetical protein